VNASYKDFAEVDGDHCGREGGKGREKSLAEGALWREENLGEPAFDD